MIDDYYNEQEQWDRVKQWLRENGLWLVAGVGLGVAALFGWNWWQDRVEAQARAASDRYDQALDAFNRNDRTRALTLLDEVRRDYGSSPYADQADLAAARSFVETNELAKAAERLTRVMNDSKDPELRLVARLRLARVQLAQGNPDPALATLDGAEPGAFAPRFHEQRGDILFAKGDKPGALREYTAALAAAEGLGGQDGGIVDPATLDLKIADLRADGVTAPEAPPAAAGAPAK